MNSSKAEVLSSVDEVIRRAVSRNQTPPATASRLDYTYTKVSVVEELDGAGKVKERKQKTYQVSLKGGLSSVKLLEVNGRAPERADIKKTSENEGTLRQMLGESKAGKGENRDNFLTPELVARFHFTLVGQEVINGRSAYQVAFRPKDPEPPVKRLVDRLLNRISGTLWIDAEEYEVARADVQLGSEVDFLGGVIGSLKKLSFTLTRARVADGLWLNTFSSGDFEGRKLLDWMRVKTKSQTRNFRPLA